MSSIAFHSTSETVRVHGPERHYAGSLCRDFLLMSLGVYREIEYEGRPSALRRLLPPEASRIVRPHGYYRLIAELQDNLALYLGAYGSKTFMIMLGSDEHVDCWQAAVNTVIVAGSDPMRFLARLDAQCELHCYVESHHKAWLAQIIEDGLRDHVLRATYDGSGYKPTGREGTAWGWQAVIDLLRKKEYSPVVMSHSSGDNFPNFGLVNTWGKWQPSRRDIEGQQARYQADWGHAQDKAEAMRDLWNELPPEQQWNTAMAALRRHNEREPLELRPDTLSTQGVGLGISGYDLRAALDEQLMRERQEREGQS